MAQTQLLVRYFGGMGVEHLVMSTHTLVLIKLIFVVLPVAFYCKHIEWFDNGEPTKVAGTGPRRIPYLSYASTAWTLSHFRV